MLISIIISTYNRANFLGQMLDSLQRLKTDGTFDFEVILVDNNSKDNTKSVIESIKAQWTRGHFEHIFVPTPGKSRALNIAIKHAKGQILAFTDDDVLVDPNWLEEIVHCFKQQDCHALGGRVLPIYPQNTKQWIKDRALKLSGAVVIYDYGTDSRIWIPTMYPFIGANYAFKREVFEQSGNFREDLGPGCQAMGEDTEFIERLAAQGKKLCYCGSAVVSHPFDPQRLSLKHVARWHISLGYFDAQREQKKEIKFIYFAKVPRYLFWGAVCDFMKLLVLWVNYQLFIDTWRSFFRKIGMIQWYRHHG